MPKIIWKDESKELLSIYVTEPYKDGSFLEIETSDYGFERYNRKQSKELADSIYEALKISPAELSD